MIFPPTPVAQAARLMHTAQVDELFQVAARAPRRHGASHPDPVRPAGQVIALDTERRAG